MTVFFKTLFITPFIVFGFNNCIKANTKPLEQLEQKVQMSPKHLDLVYSSKTDKIGISPLKHNYYKKVIKLESTIIVKKRIGNKKSILYPIYRPYIC